jgi:hydroxypyruvate isomerase
MTRRQAISRVATATAALAAGTRMLESTASAADSPAGSLKGHINHSVCKWCYNNIPLDEFCQAAKGMGIKSVELLNPGDFATLKKHGLVCAMVSSPSGRTPQNVSVGGITRAFNRLEHHDTLVEIYHKTIPQVAAAGFENLICFSGNREGLSDEKGIENCAAGLKRIMAAAEQHKVTICMELLNSKVDHKDYQCDHTAWGVELCKRVGSERFKLLYDIYHMQIMEGDVIRTIQGDPDPRRNIAPAAPYIAHYHTGGVPGRAEIDDTQEIYYPAIMKAIVETGYKGFVAQEFVPKRADKLASLKQGVGICDV